MIGNLTGMHLLIILGLIILLFGATKLPALAKGVGQSLNIFRREVTAGDHSEEKAAGADETTSSARNDI